MNLNINVWFIIVRLFIQLCEDRRWPGCAVLLGFRLVTADLSRGRLRVIFTNLNTNNTSEVYWHTDKTDIRQIQCSNAQMLTCSNADANQRPDLLQPINA